MSNGKQKVLQYLDEAYATERTLVSVLSEQIAMTPRGSYRNALERHLRETRDHANRVERRRKALGGGSGPLGSVVGIAQTAIGQALAIGKSPIDMLRGTSGEEKILKNAKDASATEALEISTYTSLAWSATRRPPSWRPRSAPTRRRCSSGSARSSRSSPTPSCAPTSRATTPST